MPRSCAFPHSPSAVYDLIMADTPVTTPTTRKKRTALWAILIALLLVASIALLMRNHEQKKPSEPVAEVTTPPPAPPEEAPPQEELAPLTPPENTIAPPMPGEEKPATQAPATQAPAKVRTRKSKPASETAEKEKPAEESQPETKVTVIEPEKAPEEAAPPAEDLQADLSPVEIVYLEDVSGVRTEHIELAIDHQVLAKKAAPQGLATREPIVLFKGVLPAGEHEVDMLVKLQGDAKVFSYVKGYKFNLDHHGKLQVSRDKATTVIVSAKKEGGMTREWTERFALRVDISERELAGSVAER